MKELKFFLCTHCGNLAGMVYSSGVPMICCGEPMKELVPNTVDAAGEKHKPVVSVAGNTVTVTVGSVAHPMTEAHLIQWVALQTEQGVQRKVLAADSAPTVTFALTEGDKPVAAYAYCNLHGLWKTEV
ncbi:MAG TPA: desulfoferrodoxin [Candidatus Faecalibacterium faecipullorum]|uniref:Desulfoferrodoxin n=1 Tax=Candidatus Faecalibacterium faecipullorum TaxID=2838578 RepID=A0A9D2S7R1_9FIRM|nr:desulfoferrodoxin [Candidatus Faecalibacterium faecipullorum]